MVKVEKDFNVASISMDGRWSARCNQVLLPTPH